MRAGRLYLTPTTIQPDRDTTSTPNIAAPLSDLVNQSIASFKIATTKTQYPCQTTNSEQSNQCFKTSGLSDRVKGGVNTFGSSDRLTCAGLSWR